MRFSFKIYLSFLFEDTSGLYRIFLNAYHGNIALAEEAAESSGISSNYFIQPLAIVAALVGSDSLLSFCLHHGATIKHEPEFLAVMKSSKPGNATLDLLLEFDFEEWKTKGLSTSMYLALSWGPGATRWFLGHGAKNSARDLVYYWPIPSSDVVKVLLDHYGIDWFKGSCFLQFAAKKPDIQIVKMLAKAGADVNENPTPFGDPREGYEPYCALIEAMVADAYKTQQDDTVRFLVDHGARLTRQDLKRYFFRPSPAMEKMIQVVESMGGIVE